MTSLAPASRAPGEPATAQPAQPNADQLAAAVITAIHRVAKQSTLYEDDNETRVNQLNATQEAVQLYGSTTGRNFSVFWMQQSVFIGRRLLRAGRTVYAAALEVADILRPLGIAQIVIGYDVPVEELRQLQEVFCALQRRMQPRIEQLTFSRIRLRRSPDIDKRFVDEQGLAPHELAARCYAKAVVVMRRLFEDLQKGAAFLPIRVHRASQQLVDVVCASPAELLALAVLHHARGDDAARAVNAAILAASMARELGASPRLLARLATAALLADLGKLRVAGVDPTGEARIGSRMPRLGEEQYVELPAATAAYLTLLGGAGDAAVTHTALVYEALHLEHRDRLEPPYGGLRLPTVAGRLVAMARRFVEWNSDAELDPPRSAGEIMTLMQQAATDPAEMKLFRLLASVLQIYPTGSLVELSTHEIAQVMHTPADPRSFGRPIVGVVVDANGQRLARPRELNLASGQVDGRPVQVFRVLAMPDASQVRAALEGYERRRAQANAAETQADAGLAEGPALDQVHEEPADPAPSTERAAQGPATPSALAPVVQTESLPPAAQPAGPSDPWAGQTPLPADDATVVRVAVTPASSAATAPSASSTAAPASMPPAAGSTTPSPTSKPPSPGTTATSPASKPPSAGTTATRAPSTPPSGGSRSASVGASPSARVAPAMAGAAASPRVRIAVPPLAPLDANGQPMDPKAAGRLADTPLIELVAYLGTHLFTGSLDLQGLLGERFVLFFDRGRPAKIYTKTQVAPLDRVLSDMKILSAERLQRSLDAIAKTGELHGEHLLAAGAISRYQLLEALRKQLIMKARAMFMLPDNAHYAVHEGANLLADYGGVEPTPVDPLQVAMAGIRVRRARGKAVDAALAEFGNLALAVNKAARIDGLGLVEDEKRVEQLLREKPRTMAQLYATEGLAEQTVRMTVYALYVAAALTATKPSGAEAGPPPGSG